MLAKSTSVLVFILVILPVKSLPQFKLPELPTFPPSPEINRPNETPLLSSQSSAGRNMEEIVKEVEAMLQANPKLPRLTRGEILDLLENITKTDASKQNDIGSNLSKDQERDPKAVMLVKPYTPESEQTHNMQELFTKPPITQIVGLQGQEKPIEDNTINTSDDVSQITKIKSPISTRGNYKRRRTTTTTTTTTTAPELSTIVEPSSSPNPPHFVQRNQVRRRRPTSTSTTSTTTILPETPSPSQSRRPLRRRPATVKYHNHRYPGDPEPEATLPPLPSEGLKVVTPPNLDPLAFNEDLLGTENQNIESVVNEEGTKPKETSNTNLQPEVTESISQSSTPRPFSMDVPEDLKGVVSDMNLDSLIEAKPLTLNNPTQETSTVKKEQYNLEDMLAAFGRKPVSSTTTSTVMPDISNVADNLNPEMRDLLMSFGLIPNPNKKPEKPVSESLVVENYDLQLPETKPEAYVGFKPLPEDDKSRDEMKELLARFGLGRNVRDQKSLEKDKEIAQQGSDKEEILTFDMIPEEYMETIEDIGFDSRKSKMVRAEALTKTHDKQHVFSPDESQLTTEEEMQKVQKLLDFVKKLEKLNGTVTEDDLEKIGKDDLKDFITTLNDYNKITPLNEQNAPNPIQFDSGLTKNEVKRQEDSSTTTTESSTEITTEMLTGEEKGPNIKDLEESFGGQTDPPTTTSAPTETTTPSRKTGFYYLVDWNTFFDIDDQKGKRVNLRFQPTIGDPKRFLSVAVP